MIAQGIGIAIRGIGKALKAYKRANRRQKLGLPRETYLQRMKRTKKAGQKSADKGIRGYKR
jgi:Sec-independent protein translocase protein TatA